jgi:hypothetical protein
VMTIAAATAITTSPSANPTYHPVEAAITAMSHLLGCSLECPSQGPFRKDSYDVPLVLVRCALVADPGPGRARRRSCRVADDGVG